MDFLPLEAQFQQVVKRQCDILIVSDRSSLLRVNISSGVEIMQKPIPLYNLKKRSVEAPLLHRDK